MIYKKIGQNMIDQTPSPMDVASEEICQLVEPDSIDVEDVCKKAFATLSKHGISYETAAHCDPDAAGLGALSGLGYAMTDIRCQPALLEQVSRIMGRAGVSLRAAMEVAFLEPYLREPFDMKDEGFKGYMRWFVLLRHNEELRWAVDEAYEMHGGTSRRERDERMFLDA